MSHNNVNKIYLVHNNNYPYFFFFKDLFSYGRVHYSDIMRRFICLRSKSNEGQTILEFGEPIELVLNITASNSSHCINFCVYSFPNAESLKWHCLSSKNRTTRIRGRRCSGIFFKALEIKCFGLMGRQLEADAVTARHVDRDCGISS